MARTLKLPAARKVRRNPMARELGGGKYHPRVVAQPARYRRRAKHPRPPPGEDA
jgi:hypothetical protein